MRFDKPIEQQLEEAEVQAHEASAEAIHKTKNAAQAIELARELQMNQAVERTAQKTKEALLEGLREVFIESDNGDPGQMKILVRRIPVLCTTIEIMHINLADLKEDMNDMKDNIKWGVRIVIGAVILGVIATIIK